MYTFVNGLLKFFESRKRSVPALGRDAWVCKPVRTELQVVAAFTMAVGVMY